MSQLVDSKEVGLAAGLLLGKKLFDFSELHYGLWNEDLEIKISNFAVAQERYSEFLLSQIPANVRTILDVGSGAGELAARLIARGYQVDCVSPSPFLTERVKASLQGKVEIFPVKFEDLQTSKKYDLVLFSESFQYVPVDLSLKKATESLNSDGYVIVSDFFKREKGHEGPLGGGHPIQEFLKTVEGLPMKTLVDKDITRETAPTMQMFGDILNEVATPLKDLVCGLVQHRHPTFSKFLGWKFKKRFQKINTKYFSGELSGENFAKYKTYRFFLLQLQRTANA